MADDFAFTNTYLFGKQQPNFADKACTQGFRLYDYRIPRRE